MTEPPPRFEVDHIFITVTPGAPEVDRLLARGLEEGPPNRHPGQGTACRRVFFQDRYLEFLWLEDRNEAASELVAPTGLEARAGLAAGASRVGIALRRVPGTPTDDGIPLETWPYRPAYLPEGMALPVATPPGALAEPLVFFLPWERAWEPRLGPHPNGVGRVTGLTLTLPEDIRSAPVPRWLESVAGLTVVPGDRERVTVELEGGSRGESVDLQPAAPLRLHW